MSRLLVVSEPLESSHGEHKVSEITFERRDIFSDRSSGALGRLRINARTAEEDNTSENYLYQRHKTFHSTYSSITS